MSAVNKLLVDALGLPWTATRAIIVLKPGACPVVRATVLVPTIGADGQETLAEVRERYVLVPREAGKEAGDV